MGGRDLPTGIVGGILLGVLYIGVLALGVLVGLGLYRATTPSEPSARGIGPRDAAGREPVLAHVGEPAQRGDGGATRHS